MRGFEISSELCATPEAVWRHATSPVGVNRELRPLLRMTFPADANDLASHGPVGETLFRSWLLLGGLIPVDYDDLRFVEIEPGRRFLERSVLWSQHEWEHERRVEPAPAGCRLSDRVRFRPRIAWLAPVHAAVFRAVFAHRHRRLRRIFGSVG